MKSIKFFTTLVLSTLFLASCSSDDDNPTPVNEEEIITTLTATLIPVGGGDTISLQYRDLDGDGPDDPVISISGALAIDTTYNGSLELLNESETPAESITEEIEEEDDEHQFFFSASNDVASFSYSDTDGDGNPVGLSFVMTTTLTPSTGNITIILRHEPNKGASGVSDGEIANAGGETDISVSFSVDVE